MKAKKQESKLKKHLVFKEKTRKQKTRKTIMLYLF